MAPKRVSNLKLAISSRLTPISLRHSSKSPTQSENVPIFATFPGINPLKHCGETASRPVQSGVARARTPALHHLLFCFELCWPLLHVRGQTFFCVFALEQQLLIFTFHRERRLHRNLPSGLHRALDSSHRFGGLIWRAELASVLHDVFHEAFAFKDVVDDTKLQRLLERKRVASDH